MYTLVLLFASIHFAKAEDCPISHRSPDVASEQQLMKDLRAKHTSLTAPNDTIQLDAHLILKSLSFDSGETTLKAFTLLIVSWNDHRLTWNTSDYGGISEITYTSYKFWEPEIRLLNEVQKKGFEYHYGSCQLQSYGDINCIPQLTHEVPCHTRLTNWPYDIQNCTILIGFYTPLSNITLTNFFGAVSLIGDTYSASWTILKEYSEHTQVKSLLNRCGEGSQLEITLLLGREGTGLGAIVVWPTILITIITLCSFLLSVHDNIRLGLICFNLLCHFLFITELSDLIPKHSADSPTILYYLRGSIMLNILLMMITIFLASLHKRKKLPPAWIIAFNNKVFMSKMKSLIWLRTKCETTKKTAVELQTNLSRWAEFSDILNSGCFWLITFVYIYFICVYIPHQPFVDRDEIASFNFQDLN